MLQNIMRYICSFVLVYIVCASVNASAVDSFTPPVANKTSIMDLPSQLLPLPTWQSPRFELCGAKKFEISSYDEASIPTPNFYPDTQSQGVSGSEDFLRILIRDARLAFALVERHLIFLGLSLAFFLRGKIKAEIAKYRAPVVVVPVVK